MTPVISWCSTVVRSTRAGKYRPSSITLDGWTPRLSFPWLTHGCRRVCAAGGPAEPRDGAGGCWLWGAGDEGGSMSLRTRMVLGFGVMVLVPLALLAIRMRQGKTRR